MGLPVASFLVVIRTQADDLAPKTAAELASFLKSTVFNNLLKTYLDDLTMSIKKLPYPLDVLHF